MQAIETLYNNQLFRSRLEAKWAAMFDLLGWDWYYEPFDLQGYIPDFVLGFSPPLLVEVKPEMEFEELKKYEAKIENSGWDKEILIVGARIFEVNSLPVLGSLGEIWENGSRWFGHGIIHKCTKCGSYSIRHEWGSWHCRKSGCYDGNHYLEDLEKETIDRLFKIAYRDTRWMPNSK